LECELESEDEHEEASSDEEEYQEIWTEDEEIDTMPSGLPSQTHSPPRKRQRITNMLLSFEQFDAMRLDAWASDDWAESFNNSPNFWRKKCDSWVTCLKDAFKSRRVRFCIKMF